MRPWETLARAAAPDGTELVLARRGDELAVRSGGRVLMSSRAHGSEDALAALGLERAGRRGTVLVGGLGLGYTVRAALDRLPRDARVVVAELVPALVEWNRGPAAALAGRPLDDPRVTVVVGDVGARLRASRGSFDAILLDVDNGPSAMLAGNRGLYGDAGVAACFGALAPGGALALWSAGQDDRYLDRLRRQGFEAVSRRVPERGAGGGRRHVVFVAERPTISSRST